MIKYYLDNSWPPLAAFFILATAFPGDPVWWLWFVLGIALFTFAEYWVHRSLLHRVMWDSKHERHHTHPHERVIFPLWYTPSIALVAYLLLPLGAFCGALVGWSYFCWWHHALHFWHLDRHPWVRKYAAWHNVHHSGAPANYGITVPVWDWLFGTYRAA